MTVDSDFINYIITIHFKIPESFTTWQFIIIFFKIRNRIYSINKGRNFCKWRNLYIRFSPRSQTPFQKCGTTNKEESVLYYTRKYHNMTQHSFNGFTVLRNPRQNHVQIQVNKFWKKWKIISKFWNFDFRTVIWMLWLLPCSYKQI